MVQKTLELGCGISINGQIIYFSAIHTSSQKSITIKIIALQDQNDSA
jgi:hypothetical protein